MLVSKSTRATHLRRISGRRWVEIGRLRWWRSTLILRRHSRWWLTLFRDNHRTLSGGNISVLIILHDLNYMDL